MILNFAPGMQLIHSARANILLLLEQFDVQYEIVPLDKDLYQECIDDALRRGYPMNGDRSVQKYLRQGVIYAANAGMHLPRNTQIWIALYTSCSIFVDETSDRFPEEMPNMYLFNDRFIHNEPQGSGVLDAFADITRRASDLYSTLASHLIATSTLCFVTGNLLEHESKSMKISSAAQEYPTYQRILTGLAGAYAFMAFPRDIPLNDYIQAIPKMLMFINELNDVFSFYKEEQAGETTNHVCTQAARRRKSKAEALDEVTEETTGLYKGIIEILEGSAEAREAFKHYAVGYVYFHTSSGRYRLEDLGL